MVTSTPTSRYFQLFQKKSPVLKTISCYVFLLLVGCTHPNPQNRSFEKKDSVTLSVLKADSSGRKYYTTEATVTILKSANDSVAFSRDEFNSIIDKYPELTSEFVYPPDITYHKSTDSNFWFSSEAGQDTYYVLYAYLLRKRYGGDTLFADRRKKLEALFQRINQIQQIINGGGTYFGHQTWRISGYVEYALYVNRSSKYDQTNDDQYFLQQKKLFIQTLRLIVKDIHRHRSDFSSNAVKEYTQRMNRTVDEIATYITDKFYLRYTKQFLYNCYIFIDF